MATIALDSTAQGQGLIGRIRGEQDALAGSISIKQLAGLIDELDEDLYDYGKVVVKGPDVWGQNRMTPYRQEFEKQMKGQLDTFELILNSYQRRSDVAALTSATTIAAAVQPRVTNSRNVTTNTATVTQPTVADPSSLVANANTLIGSASPLLSPSNLTALGLSNSGARQGIGLEPTIALDERSRFINHLHQLRRINAGDDRTDLPGYGLYLVRIPVSILPGEESIRGKGATVTVQAKLDLTPDLLANTFRNVVILDTAYQLMDLVTRGQYVKLQEEISDCGDPVACETKAIPKLPGQGLQGGALPQPGRGGSTAGGHGLAASTDVAKIYGVDALKMLVCAVQGDQLSWYRHDPSVVAWLLGEIAAAHTYMREEARTGNPLFQPESFERIGSLALSRNFVALRQARDSWFADLAALRSDRQIRPIDILSFALIVQSAYLDRQLKADMQVMAQRHGCGCGDPYQYFFHALWPDPEAQRAFAQYVGCKWPVHVFALDPAVDQQNQLDLFSQRTELQLAMATAVATGQATFRNATSYARRLEQDLAAVALNRTAVGFGAGEATFGWRFYPRVQTPPTPGNLRRVAGILANNGYGPDYDLRNRRIEPGPRECYALMVVPNFAPSIRLTTTSNWFDLKAQCNEKMIETTDMVRLSRKLQDAKAGLERACDAGRYRPEELELLGDRLAQLEAMLPLQGHKVALPFEGDLTGSEMFTSYNAGLGPRLLTWYGEPAREGKASSIFLYGSGFSVHETRAIVGGVTVGDSGLALLSRNVIQLEIPEGAQAVETQSCVPDANGNPVRRKVIDVHVASPNGVSNHLLVEVTPAQRSSGGEAPKTVSTTVTTTIKPSVADGSTTTTTKIQTEPPGIVLPPGTILPMGTTLPAAAGQAWPILGGFPWSGAPGCGPSWPPGTVPFVPPGTTVPSAAEASGRTSGQADATNPERSDRVPNPPEGTVIEQPSNDMAPPAPATPTPAAPSESVTPPRASGGNLLPPLPPPVIQSSPDIPAPPADRSSPFRPGVEPSSRSQPRSPERLLQRQASATARPEPQPADAPTAPRPVRAARKSLLERVARRSP